MGIKLENVLIVGGNRGLGEALAKQYSEELKATGTVHATTRYAAPQNTTSYNLKWIPNIDITQDAGHQVYLKYEHTSIDLLIICSNYFAVERFHTMDYERQLKMYKTNVIGPALLIQHLVTHHLLKSGSRIVLVGGESGSIALRTEVGGNYGGHGSKAALNMTAKLLSNDLKAHNIAIAVVHTGYIRKMKEDGTFESDNGSGALKPHQAAKKLRDWIQTFDMSKTGQFWAVRGVAGIPSAEKVLGKENVSVDQPVQLPW